MKTQTHERGITPQAGSQSHGRRMRRHAPDGFALIVTLSLMILLIIIAVGLLSLSSIGLRSASHDDSQARARANARLALMIALGELQTAAGPDQRITADASILDETAEHPNYLAVLDSWDTFLNEEKYLRDADGTPTSEKLSIQATYQKGRHPKLFNRYLVSHPNPELLRTMAAATDPGVLSLDDGNSVLLAGEGTTGSAAKDKTVRVGLVDVKNGSRGSGRMGWWVGGLNSRPSIDLETEANADKSLAGARNFAAEPQGPAISAMTGLGNFPDDIAGKSRLVSIQQGEIIAPDRDAYRANSLNLGAGGQWSLLADVRGSGMKKDINAFFENPLPPEYQSANFLGVPIEAPLRSVNGLDKLGVVEKNIPPTSWRQLRDYYSLYLQDTSHQNHLGYAPAHVSWDSKGAPVSQAFMCGDTIATGIGHHTLYDNYDNLSYARQPVIARWLYIFSLSSKEVANSAPKRYKLYVHVHPVFVLWNPYSTQLRFQTREIGNTIYDLDSDFLVEHSFIRALNVEYKVYNNDATSVVLNNWTLPPTDYNSRADSFFAETTSNREVTLRPGEVKIFSYDSSVLSLSEHNALLPGFSPALSTNEKLRFEVGEVLAGDKPSLALRFTPTKAFGGSPQNSTNSAGSTTAFAMSNLGQVFDNDSGKARKSTRGMRGSNPVEWFDPSDQPLAAIIPDRAGERAEWKSLGNEAPLPEAAVGMFLKSATELPENDGLASSSDVRSRNWLHGNPSLPWRCLFLPNQLKRSNFPYELHYDGNLAGNGVASLVQSFGNNAFIGASIEAGGTSFFPYQELPVAPATNLAALSGMRLAHGKTIGGPMPRNNPSTNWWANWGVNDHYAAAWGAAFGHGIGNAYAHPMIGAKDIYTGYPDHINYTSGGQPVFANYWDTLLMANDALWDSWFCSSVAPQPAPAYGSAVSRNQVIESFVKGTKSLPNHRLRLYSRTGKTDEDIIAEFKQSDAYLKMASHMMVRGGFNVNTASVDAWKALLHGLKGREVPFIDAVSLNKGSTPASDDELVLSRFGIASGGTDGDDPSDDSAWRGIRRLNKAQIDRLAEEIAKQVRLRGPFLNMSEFINRRLSDDRFGVSGAIQAAIDWDEFDNDYNGTASGGTASINGKFKQDMIKNPTANYANMRAARGSRYAGIPGYVMQSDLLRAMGNVLTVRDDSFVIRSYGESRDSGGKVTAQAWCEAVVQRMPEYLDGSNAPETPAYTLDSANRPQPSATMSEVNRRFGRKFAIQSFRWLSEGEVL